MKEVNSERLAFLLPSLAGGGAERAMLTLARAFVERGLKVDLILGNLRGPYVKEVHPAIRILELRRTHMWLGISHLVNYLRQEQPVGLISSLANVLAICAKRLAGVATRVVLCEQNYPSISLRSQRSLWRRITTPYLMRLCMPWADNIVAVSTGVAKNLACVAGLTLDRINVIYNPVVTAEMMQKASEPMEHPWFAPGGEPVILGVGRLTEQKNFPLLLQAFYILRQHLSARLMILGEGEDRALLEAMIRKLGLQNEVELPGFVGNPYPYLSKASVFVLSSLHEGLPTVLIEAMALGTPVVATDCPSGPSEILEGGKYGKLVPVGDAKALSDAVVKSLGEKPDTGLLQKRARDFSVERAVEQYMGILNLNPSKI